MAYESPWQDPNQQYPGGPMTYDNSGTGRVVADDFGYNNEQPSWNLPFGSSQQGGFDFGNWLFGNTQNNMLGALPLAGMAGQQFYNADKYRDLGNEAANRADPFGLGNRQKYQGLLSQIYDDPTAFLNSPGHQAVVTSGMNAIQARNRAGGYMGSGKDQTDLANYLASENAKYLDQEKGRLSHLAGAQFDPANAANMLMRSGELGLGAQNNALGALGMMYQNALGQPAGTMNRPGLPQSMGGMAAQGARQAAPQLANMFGGGGFTPNLSSPYWSQFANPSDSWFNNMANQQMGVTAGNTGIGNTGYDEFGGSIDPWGNPSGTDYGMGPTMDSSFGGGGESWDSGNWWDDGFDPFSWFGE